MASRGWYLFLVAQALGLVAAAKCGQNDTVYFPLNYRSGDSKKVSTDLTMPWSNETMEVSFDTGSENFWVFGPETKFHWGGRFPHSGPCYAPAGHPFYDYVDSPRDPVPEKLPEPFVIGYGGESRYVFGNNSVTDSVIFASDAVTHTVDEVVVGIPDELWFARLVFNCSANEPALYGAIDRSILGTRKYIRTPEYNSTGPQLRQSFVEKGIINNQIQSMWFDEAPEGFKETFTGGAIFGGVDPSKYTGPLVKVATRPDDYFPSAYNTKPPRLAVSGKPIAQTDFALDFTNCLMDSGTSNDAVPIVSTTEDELMAAANLVKLSDGRFAYNGTCESVPRDVTIDLTFDGVTEGEEVTIKVPLFNYAHQQPDFDAGEIEGDICPLSLFTSEGYKECVFGAPFHTAGFFAADDTTNTIALAQGGVSKRGSTPDHSRVVDTLG